MRNFSFGTNFLYKQQANQNAIGIKILPSHLIRILSTPNWNLEIERLISLQVLLIKSGNALLHKMKDPLELSYLTDKGSAICIHQVVFNNLLDYLINTRL